MRSIIGSRGVVAVALLLMLSACGWQLQGAHRVSEQLLPLYLEFDDIHSPFAEALLVDLKQAGVAVTRDRAQAHAVLRVSRDSSGHHVSSVSALNEPQQYEVFYTIQYQLDGVSEKPQNLIASQDLNASRTMTYDKTLALAKQREELQLRDTLAGELARQVMSRLSLMSPPSP